MFQLSGAESMNVSCAPSYTAGADEAINVKSEQKTESPRFTPSSFMPR